MDDRVKKFRELYDEYKTLAISTHVEAQMLKKGEPYKIYHLKSNELARRKQLAKELVKNYKDFFEIYSTEWFDLERDTV